MGAGGTRVSNKQAVATTNLAANAVTTAKISALTVIGADISAGAVIASKLGAAAVTPAKVSANYNTFSIPFEWSGASSTAADTLKVLHFFSSPATVVGMWFAHSGLATGPTVKIKVDCHVVKAIGSAAASTNSIFRGGEKLTSVATPMAIASKVASGVVSGAANAILYVVRDIHGSAVGTTKVWGAVTLKQRSGY